MTKPMQFLRFCPGLSDAVNVFHEAWNAIMLETLEFRDRSTHHHVSLDNM
jgi:hypothetical protein